ncbi:hypothetical protein ACFPK9_02240 [Rubritalea spongiae]|uniref:TonB C-terminal domain-containing protein n=1 Tax=Rubritalea spongiae TaxID=430797 RepID=A0ABW5E395_9BACT
MVQSKEKLIGVVAAVMIHLLLAVALTQEAIIKWLFPKPKSEQAAEVKDKAKTVVSFRIAPKPKVKPEPIPETKVEEPTPEPEPSESQFMRTAENQLKGKPKNTRFYGNRDTLAQSNADTDANAPERASVKGEKREYENATASEYKEGSIEHENPGSPEIPPMPKEMTSPPSPEAEIEVAQEKSDGLISAPDAGKPLAGSNIPLVDYMETVKKLPSQVRTKETNDKIDLADKGKAKTGRQEENKEVTKAEDQAKPRKDTARPSSQSTESGFTPLSKATEMVGSITRRGSISSNDVEGTPLGKYTQKVQNAIAAEWTRRLGQHRDLVLPGSIRIRWYVYDDGKVKIDPYHVYKKNGSEIQFGITFQSITSAKIPKMPADLKRDLNGDPISMVINFHF